MEYTVIIEKTGNGFSAYVPDIPGCIAAADTREETAALIASALRDHLELMREGGDPIPPPTTLAEVVQV
jgi:predicted RNase H-like HicB family nuclease